MRLTNVLLYYIRRRHIPGKIDIGKNRLVRPVTCTQKKNAMVQMIAEEKNLEILNNPYLSEAEDYRHERDMGLLKEKWEKTKIERIEKTWLRNRPMEEGFANLEMSKNWE